MLSDSLSFSEWIAALDASFIRKSGNKTEGLGVFNVEKKQVWHFCFQRIRIWMQ